MMFLFSMLCSVTVPEMRLVKSSRNSRCKPIKDTDSKRIRGVVVRRGEFVILTLIVFMG